MTIELIAIIFVLAYIVIRLEQIKSDVLEIKQNQLPMIQKCCDHEKYKPEVIDNVLYHVCDVCGYMEVIG